MEAPRKHGLPGTMELTQVSSKNETVSISVGPARWGLSRGKCNRHEHLSLIKTYLQIITALKEKYILLQYSLNGYTNHT